MAVALTERVLVTGATGLIGQWVTRQWPAGWREVVAMGSRDADLLVPGEATRVVRCLRPSAVVHLAWSASGDPHYRDSDENDAWLRSTIELVDATRELGARCWLTGSVVDESPVEPEAGVDAYALSKSRLRRACAEDISSGAVGWMRPTYVFDPDRGRPALVAECLQAVRTSRKVPLRTPSTRHDFIHAADVASAVILAVKEQVGGVLPIGSGSARSVVELVTSLGADWMQPPGTTQSKSTHSETVVDIGWLRALGWTPQRTDQHFRRSGSGSD